MNIVCDVSDNGNAMFYSQSRLFIVLDNGKHSFSTILLLARII